MFDNDSLSQENRARGDNCVSYRSVNRLFVVFAGDSFYHPAFGGWPRLAGSRPRRLRAQLPVWSLRIFRLQRTEQRTSFQDLVNSDAILSVRNNGFACCTRDSGLLPVRRG